MLTVDTIPLRFRIPDSKFQIESGIWNVRLFILFVQTMAPAATAKLVELQPVRRVLFVFRRYVIALFALGALQNYVISRHFDFLISNSRFQIPDSIWNLKSGIWN